MSSLLRAFRKRSLRVSLPSSQYPRNVSITCRGKPIGHGDLYRYTNGRFLVDEPFQFKRRHVTFDVPKLCGIAASVGRSNSPVVAIEKLEGGFSKALLMRKEDGTELIAKIPCPNAGPVHYTTASEVAVLQYVKDHTTVPVPEVFAWSSDPSNPVGCEYIIMEKAAGTQLFKVWSDMHESSKLALIKKLTELESQLATLKFPASGHLYLRQSIADEAKRTLLDSTIDPSGSYCIGRSCDRSWLTGSDAKGSEVELPRGPWTSTSAYGIALAKREISRILHASKPATSIRRDTSREQVFLLETTVNLLQTLESSDVLKRYGNPTLWHTDLHMGNIYVSETEPSQILSIIDWQSISVSPLFLQADWPVFLKPPKGYTTGFKKPTLPENFEQLSSEDKTIAMYEWKQATWTKAYEVSSYLNDAEAYHAMNVVPHVFRELFLRCGSTCEEGTIPLRACLIEIFQSWKTLDLPSECPYTFTDNEIGAHETEFKQYEEWHRVQEFAREYLDTDAEGWISPEEDFEKKCEQNKDLFEILAREMAGEESREELRAMWPFSNHL